MATFETAYSDTEKNEGGYVNDPHDTGGETYKGISRRYNPSWAGWQAIDEIKRSISSQEMNRALQENEPVQRAVAAFYKSHYWDKFWGDQMPEQAIADEIFDTSVNMGVHRAVMFLQEGLNLLNRDQKNYDDISEDGVFGPTTLDRLQKYLAGDKPEYLLKLMNVLQGMHYIEFMKKNPVQEKFARGWLSRVNV